MFDKNNRIFYLSNDVDEGSIGDLCFNLLCILEEDDKKDQKEKDYKREPIKFYIQSYGGDIYGMWALVDIMLDSKTPIYTYCTGYAMSAGLIIFLAGHKRFVSKHATLLYHQMSGFRSGKYQDLVEDREEMDHLQETIEEYVVSRTKLTKKDLKKIRETKRDVYYHADEAIELGIADEIIG